MANYFQNMFEKLLLLYVLLLLRTQIATAPTTTSVYATTKFVPHRFTSNNNITILHEISDDNDEKIELNTREVLPIKPVKKKPYTSLNKAVLADYEKSRPPKEYELHPVTFDFNLGDLEDLEHETIKKSDLSSEEKRLLRNENDKGLTYTERTLDVTDDTDEILISEDGDANGAAGMSMDKPTTTAIVSTNTINAEVAPLQPVITVSPHIFKILKNKTSKKGRELLEHEEMQKTFGTNFNSISRYIGVSNENATADMLYAVNIFQIVTNLYDHFYWQSSEIRTKITTGCGLEMQAYLTALHGNYEWAQKAYDASGRYRGQLFFGNDKWLGQKTFCYELNRQLDPGERKHFDFEFYTAVIVIRLWVPKKIDINLQVGECLPKSCTSQDVLAILSLDPHAKMLGSLKATNASVGAIANDTLVHVLRVRTVPGIFSYWRELKFQVFASFLLTLVLLVTAATWYQAKLNQRQLTPSVTAVSAKIEANVGANGIDIEYNNGKSFELYQINTVNDNNAVEIDADCNGNKRTCRTTEINCSDEAPQDSNKQKLEELTAPKMNEADVMDYKMETSSSAGATGTYEAKKSLGLHEQVLLCFAFQTNSDAIMNIEDNKETQTSCVHGLRVLSVLWTILVHTYLQMFTIAENRFLRVIVERSLWYQFVGNATFSVDTFFFISGLLVTLLFLKQDKKYPEHPGQFAQRSFKETGLLLIYRYVRLTPAYLFVIFFNDFSLRQTFDVSVFQPTVAPNTCSLYWWRNILYINNFYPLSEICMIWSWYMANDMQFYIMASLLLVLSARYFKTAVLTALAILLSSWGTSGVISLHYRYTHKVSNPFESFDFLYDKPWQRVGTYIMGMIAGYVLYKVKTPPKVSNRTNWLLWTSSCGLLALIIFGVPNGELSMLATAFYVGIGHTAFGFALIWIVLSCCWGLSPTANRILAYRGLWPLSRLTYCTYLIHPVIMLITSFRMNGTVHLNNLFVMTIFLGNAVVSFVAAFFISVLFEGPIIRLLKLCIRK